MIPQLSRRQAPSLGAAEMRRIDAWMIEDVGVSLLQMMENAGRALARLASFRFLAGAPQDKSVVVLAGAGGNGGGALAAARNLANWGARVAVVLSADRSAYGEAPRRQLDVLRWASVAAAPVSELKDASPVALVLDGLVGYSLRGPLRGPAAEAVAWANHQPAPVLSLDLPSGLDPDRGLADGEAMRAAATLTLALPKHGLFADTAGSYVGELYLADIGVPPALYRRLDPPRDADGLFAAGDIVRLL